jgi:hypothetical protein
MLIKDQRIKKFLEDQMFIEEQERQELSPEYPTFIEDQEIQEFSREYQMFIEDQER